MKKKTKKRTFYNLFIFLRHNKNNDIENVYILFKMFIFFTVFLNEPNTCCPFVTKVKTTQVVGNSVLKNGGRIKISTLLDCLHSDTFVFNFIIFICSITLKFVLEVFFPPYMGKELALKCVCERKRGGRRGVD